MMGPLPWDGNPNAAWCAHLGWHNDGECVPCGEPGTRPQLILVDGNRIKWVRVPL